MNKALDLIARLKKLVWGTLRIRTRGVKVMLFNAAGEIMLIRNSYGRPDIWVFPGGGMRPFESAGAAAAREVREEVGCEVAGLRFVSSHFSRSEGKRDTIRLFHALAVGDPEADGFEVEEARFFALDALPAETSPATLRRIEEYRGERAADGRW
jgi:8-oxo-dGTP pyrophosphatase MutT (NUDIX family)